MRSQTIKLLKNRNECTYAASVAMAENTKAKVLNILEGLYSHETCKYLVNSTVQNTLMVNGL